METNSASPASAPKQTGIQAVSTLLATWSIGFFDTCWNIAENLGDKVGFSIAPRVSQAALDGKVCIVTGGNAGIGRATAELLAARGAHVILACRSKERGEAAAAAIQARVQPLPGCGQPHVEVMQVDMSSLKSVRNFCHSFNQRKLPLHLLVANAGIMSPATRLETEDRLEMQFQVNFLSHWLMAHSLLAEQRMRRASAKSKSSARHKALTAGGDTLDAAVAPLHLTASSSSTNLRYTPAASAVIAEASAPGAPKPAVTVVEETQGRRDEFVGWGLPEDGTRVVMVTSLTHHAGILNWHDMQSLRKYNPFTSYGLSKLANAMTACELQRRLDSHKDKWEWGADSAVSVHPGVVDTELATNFFKNQGMVEWLPGSKPLVNAFVDNVAPLLMKTTANSAAVMGVAALAPADKVAGRYLANGRTTASAPAVRDPELAQELWSVAQQLTGITIHSSLQ